MIKVAVIGQGRNNKGLGIGAYIIREIVNNKNAVLTAIGGTSLLSINKSIGYISDNLCEVSKDIELYNSENINGLFESKNVDIVIIASPDETHLRYIELALKHKKHVLCEKPFFPFDERHEQNLELLTSFFNKARRNNTFLSLNCQRSYIPIFLKEQGVLPDEFEQVEIGLSIGIKNELLDAESLFKLCISHLSGILVKLGIDEIQHFKEQEIVFEENDNKVWCLLSFKYIISINRLINVKLKLVQSSNTEAACVSIAFDKNRVTKICGLNTSEGFKTEYDLEGNNKIYTEDLLAINIDQMIKSIDQPGIEPLVDNIEALKICGVDNMFWGFVKQSIHA